jgi:glycosyltransferase involved in cell wall biosynthesis
MQAPEVSVLIPVGERYDDTKELFRDYKAALAASGRSYEIIYILDGRKDDVARDLESLIGEGEPITALQFGQAFGEAAALTAAFDRATGQIILTLPAYFQAEASEIPRLLDALAKCDMVVTRRWPRRGGALGRFRRMVFHRLIAWLTGQRFNDLGCSVRAFRRDVVAEIAIYGDQHRFLPLLAIKQGFSVREVDVKQSPKDEFRGAYRLREYAHRILDILTVLFLMRFTKKPLRFFGMLGTIIFLLGAIFLAILVIQKVVFAMALADRPALLLSSLLVVVGLQLFALGLLGELIIFTHARELKEYKIERIIN